MSRLPEIIRLYLSLLRKIFIYYKEVIVLVPPYLSHANDKARKLDVTRWPPEGISAVGPSSPRDGRKPPSWGKRSSLLSAGSSLPVVLFPSSLLSTT